jgi:tRNA(Ile)-lysidine synthase
MELERQLANWVRRHRLLGPGDRIGVAVSGGSDSVALLRLLHAAAESCGWQLAVAHFDHGWRPSSGADAEFVAGLAAALGLPFHLGRASAPRGQPPRRDPEQTARRQRYAFFHALIAAGHIGRIATAHTLDDQAETVLLRLLRGTGPGGLAGVLPLRGLERAAPGEPPDLVVRPLLWATRVELRAWLDTLGQRWREDPTNLDLTRRRNWVRHQLLPMMTAANPALARRLAATAELAQAEEAFWASYLAPLSQRLWTPSSGGAGGLAIRARRADFALLPVAVQRRLLRDGIRRVQGNLHRVDFHGIEAVIAALADALPQPRRFHCGAVICRLDARQLELAPRPVQPGAAAARWGPRHP